MLRIVLIRPGATEYDEQGRIKGMLDVPLSAAGSDQAARTACELANFPIEVVYSAPCQPAQQTAQVVANALGVKVRLLEKLHNLDQGLWQGKLIEEVRQTQPRVYRQWQEHPETVCPPQGEMLSEADERVDATLRKLLRKHHEGVVALVVPEPLASLVRRQLTDAALGDLWKAECECGQWELVEVRQQPVAS